jgi:tetratricopeptide (TPR) repeat protein
MSLRAFLLCLPLAALSSPAVAENARELLMDAAFAPSNKTTALDQIDQALKAADAALARNPGDQDSRLQRAIAISYRGKLERSRSDLALARRGFEAAVLADPRNAEAHMALAGWHLGAVIELGPFMARTALGASKAQGLKALGQSLALGRNRACFLAFASLVRIQLDPSDREGAERLARAAIDAKAPTSFDRIMQRQAATLLGSLQKDQGKAAAKAAKMLLPFGRVR